MTAPAAGLLACFECHGERPAVNNFGNIFAGHNAVRLIERAVSFNTGGMGYFSAYYTDADLADIAAYLGNTPAQLRFAPTQSGSRSEAQRVSISAGTKIDITGLALTVEGDFEIAATDCSAIIPRFGRCSVDLAFRPVAGGQRNGQLLIAHAGTPTPVRIALSGEGQTQPPALATLAPAVLTFAPARAGALQGKRRGVVLSNTGEQPLRLAGVSIDGGAFRVAGGDCSDGRVLQPGAACAISVTFEPRTPGPYTGELLVRHDGVGALSRVALQGQATADAAPPPWPAVPAHLDFGRRSADSPSAALTVTLRNPGADAAHVLAIEPGDPSFVVLGDDCRDGALAPGASCRVTLGWQAQRPGDVAAMLRVRTAAGREPVALLLRGGQFAATAGAGVSAPSAVRLEAAPGASAQTTLQLVQRGSAAAGIGTIAIDGADAGRFAVLLPGGLSDCAPGSVLAPGVGCRIVLRFDPMRQGAHHARLRIEVSGAEPIAVDLQGEVRSGDSPRWTVDQRSLEFSGWPDERTVTVRNLGETALRLAEPALVPAVDSGFMVLGHDCAPAQGVPPGGRCTVRVGYQPSATKPASATLALREHAGQGSAALTLQGEVAAPARPRLRFEAAWVDFGRVAPGVRLERRLVIRNEGAASAPALQLTADAGFAISRVGPQCTRPLGPGQRCEIDIAWQPADPGSATGWVRAVAGAAEARATLKGRADAAAPQLAWQRAAPDVRFEATEVGNASVGRWLVLTNSGSAAVPLPAWQIDGPEAADFSLDPASTCAGPGSLAPGASCTLRVRFHPGAAGDRHAWATAAAGGEAVAVLPLAGQAHARARPRLVLQPARLRFDSVPGASPRAATAWLSNDGIAALFVERVEVLGEAFSQARDDDLATLLGCRDTPRALLPGEGCTLSVAWDGSAAGQRGGTLRVEGVAEERAEAMLEVVEDAAARSNVGAGGGAMTILWLVGLLAATIAATARRPPESRHVPHA